MKVFFLLLFIVSSARAAVSSDVKRLNELLDKYLPVPESIINENGLEQLIYVGKDQWGGDCVIQRLTKSRIILLEESFLDQESKKNWDYFFIWESEIIQSRFWDALFSKTIKLKSENLELSSSIQEENDESIVGIKLRITDHLFKISIRNRHKIIPEYKECNFKKKP